MDEKGHRQKKTVGDLALFPKGDAVMPVFRDAVMPKYRNNEMGAYHPGFCATSALLRSSAFCGYGRRMRGLPSAP